MLTHLSFFKQNISYEKKSHTMSGSEVIKLFSCSTQLSMRFFLLINVKMPTTVGILILMNSILAYLSLKKADFHDIFYTCIY